MVSGAPNLEIQWSTTARQTVCIVLRYVPVYWSPYISLSTNFAHDLCAGMSRRVEYIENLFSERDRKKRTHILTWDIAIQRYLFCTEDYFFIFSDVVFDLQIFFSSSSDSWATDKSTITISDDKVIELTLDSASVTTFSITEMCSILVIYCKIYKKFVLSVDRRLCLIFAHRVSQRSTSLTKMSKKYASAIFFCLFYTIRIIFDRNPTWSRFKDT